MADVAQKGAFKVNRTKIPEELDIIKKCHVAIAVMLVVLIVLQTSAAAAAVSGAKSSSTAAAAGREAAAGPASTARVTRSRKEK